MIKRANHASKKAARISLKRTATHRPVRLRTPLGSDAVMVRRISGKEELSSPFHYELELVTENRSFDPGSLIGSAVTIDIDLPRRGVRHINGIIWSCQREPGSRRVTRVRAVIVPWLRLLKQSIDCRIFQRMSVPEIIKQVFRDHGFSAFRDTLSATYPRREYCVQYQETALAFVTRLMEDEGICYRFDHTRDRHELVLMDTTTVAEPSRWC